MKYNRILSLIAFALVGGAAAWAQPRISSNKEQHNFGQIEWKHPVTVDFTITNSGDKPLVLTNVTTSCACSVASWTQSPIAPGEKGSITATFDAKALGRFEKSICIYSNAQPGLVYLRFLGEVVEKVTDYTEELPHTVGSIRTDLTEITFSDVHRGETPSLSFSVVNLSDRPYEPLLMHLPSYLQVVKSPGILSKGEKGEVQLMLNTDKLTDLGLTQSSVYLARFMGDKVSEENEIPVSIVLLPNFSQLSDWELLNAPAIGLSETEIDLQTNRTSKASISHDILVSNNGASPLKINKLQVFNSAVGVSLKKSTLEPGESTKLRITVRRREIDKKRSRLRVLMITNDPKQPKVEINLKR